MRYMGNARRAAYAISLIAAGVAYCALLVYDHLSFTGEPHSEIIANHLANAGAIRRVDGIIFGGSNAYFGLSAQEISHQTGQHWYNASLLNEGFSDRNFLNFAAAISRAVDAVHVNNVVYSSIYVYVRGWIKKRERTTISLTGRRAISFRPLISGATHLKQFLTKSPHINSPLIPDEFGDLRFGGVECVPGSRDLPIEREDINVVGDFLANHITELHNMFPNARIFFVFPPVLEQESVASTDADFEKGVTEYLSNKIQRHTGRKERFWDLIFQPQFPSKDYTCDVLHHANAAGRRWRTGNLMAYLK